MAPRPMFAAVVATLLLCLPCWARYHDQQYLAAVPFDFRDAVGEDAGEFATVLLDAFSPDPDWRYIHQFEDEYPDYAWNCMRKTFKPLLEDPAASGLTIRVIAVPDETSERGSRVVSLSVWQFNKTSESTQALWPMGIAAWSDKCDLHLDINMTRSDQFVGEMTAAQKKYLDDVYPRQVYLGGLATHPKWDGNGFAATHLHWGMALADNMGLPTTLIGTPAGHPLYKSVGFQDIHNITFERLDGKGIIWHEVMKYPA
ncbi:hypothetical protein JX265_010900 [Neoarthrinium moseri]|uniref:N-acetyltransferase domain-containing protein n=1 Tax=Neoarthrinium moseri TaxID=1658444 RepID=A0A9P9WDE6_9PEZI|nr:uncharacterized protein JN550_008989 [Neoarthrinium moseri]KAI1846316.1 hypothetical protein JX266_007521 [Neoarthrinium moseri]KAI1858232.1 hypothetical protein JX265_010900 [Neoarthrinium moseri]KAI1864432.1 hypothetical protein JN550_008989 [Neoarthrinium moseri]